MEEGPEGVNLDEDVLSSNHKWLLTLAGAEDFTQTAIPVEIAPVVKPLVSELALQVQSIKDGKQVKYKELEPLLITLMRRCHSATDFALCVANYLLSTKAVSVTHGLGLLAESVLESKSYAQLSATFSRTGGIPFTC